MSAASSDTLGQAIQRIERFSRVVNEAIVFRVSNVADLDTRLDYAGVARHSDRHQVEFSLTTLVRLCRSLTGLSLTPVRVTICHSRADGVAEQRLLLAARPSLVRSMTWSSLRTHAGDCLSSALTHI